jgi:hypothetical protein
VPSSRSSLKVKVIRSPSVVGWEPDGRVEGYRAGRAGL